jgi:hypothetical protein
VRKHCIGTLRMRLGRAAVLRISVATRVSTTETAETGRLGRRVKLAERVSPLELFFDAYSYSR